MATVWTEIGGTGVAIVGYPVGANVVDANAYVDLNAAITAVGASKRVVVISSGISLSANLTIPSNVALYMQLNGSIASGGYSLDIQGHFEAGRFQVFSGFSAGAVSFGSLSVEEVYPEWFGAIADGTTDSSSAFAQAISSSNAMVRLSEGTYLANFSITAPNKRIEGQSPRSTYIKPYSNAAVITIDSTAGAIQFTKIANLGLSNDSTGFTQPGIVVQGSNINDYIRAHNLFIYKFTNGIKVIGRTIWNDWRNILIQESTGNGFHVEMDSDFLSFNANTFTNVFSNNGAAHGFYFKDTGTSGFQGNTFYSINAESNGDCGFRIDGLSGGFSAGGGIYNSYFESNTQKAFYATGTVLIGFSYNNNLAWNSGSGTDYDNSVTLTQGELKGNRFSGKVHVETAHDNSQIEIGSNYTSSANFEIINDSNGRNHVNFTSPAAGGALYGNSQMTFYTSPVTVPTVGASPWLYQNPYNYDVDVFYTGGTVSQVYIDRGSWGGTNLNASAGIMHRLSPGDKLYFTYSSTPTVYVIPR